MKNFSRVWELVKNRLEQEKKYETPVPIEPVEISKKFDLSLVAEPVSEEDFWSELTNVVEHTPKTAGPQFFNQLFAGRNDPAMVGEILASVMNNSIHTYKSSGVQIAIEKEVIKKIAQHLGFARHSGTCTSGGSVSNMLAMMVARNERWPEVSTNGWSKNIRPTAYTSVDSHYSVKKAVSVIGIGTDNLRTIATDQTDKMDVHSLRKKIMADIAAGFTPFFVNATAGTTVFGAFDDLVALRKLCDEYGLWLHTDASWGAGASFVPSKKKLLEGSANVDSCTWNAHKSMGVPVTASYLVVNKPDNLLAKHLSVKEDYLFQGDADNWNPGLSSLQCGRRNNSLKVWCAWKYHGDNGYQTRIGNLFDLVDYTVTKIKDHTDLELVRDPVYLNICFNVKDVCPKHICQTLYKTGQILVGYAQKDGNFFIRLILVNPDITKRDIDRLLKAILDVRILTDF